MKLPDWLPTLVVGGGIWAVLQAQISGWWQRKKTEGEGRQASGAGAKAEADAEAVDSDARIKEWGEHIRHIREDRAAAEAARDVCRVCLVQALDALDSVLDTVERVLSRIHAADIETEEAVKDLRVVLRAGRHTVVELRP